MKEAGGIFQRAPQEALRKTQSPRFSNQQTVVRDILIGFIYSHQLKERVSDSDISETFCRVYRHIFFEIASHPFLLEKLTLLHQTDLVRFHHSLKVAVTSGIVGLALRYDSQQLYELTIGALLFDIGMTQLPESLIHKAGPLTKRERSKMEKHTVLGYQMLSSHRDVPQAAALCALMHHERLDGSGYPHHQRQPHIHPYAQIVGIADVYNALISPRSYRSAYTYHEALEYLYGAGNKLFDGALVKTFTKHICVYPMNSKVLLSNGKIGVVSVIDSDAIHLPVVKVIQKLDGTLIHPSYEIDLKKNLDVVIINSL
ncbi:HD-GYP domain-containing protein [Brevibacillus sp. B_LB10_24]|uniref:HD-GYP domain-containing protein n=1 Tax=Brevibacillus sp. B_LB10_24 TaxID=3380645 RepID=UPI0038B76453